MKVESITLVPMTKESIFEDDFEDFEFSNITKNVDEWWEVQVKWNGQSFLDAVEDLYAEIKKAKYYMTAPNARFGYETVLAVTRIITDPKELTDMISKHGSNFLLYAVLKDRFVALPEGGFASTKVHPDIPPRYKVRYAIKGQNVELSKKIDAEKYFEDPRLSRPVGRPGGYFIPRGNGEFVKIK